MNNEHFNAVLLVLIPIAVLLTVAVKVITHRLDTIIDLQYQTCLNTMDEVGDSCEVRL